MEESSQFKKTKAALQSSSYLYEDPDFPPSHANIETTQQLFPKLKWMRPAQIVPDPVFIKEGFHRYDIHQGVLKDCFLLAGAACLATLSPQLFLRVVPPNQSFGKDYTGLFRFNFWRYNSWVEVWIDDRIPTNDGKPIFAFNRTDRKHVDNEFWVALMEKAYAKLNGGYENLNGGYMNEALVDMTGGISERVNILEDKDGVRSTLFDLMVKTSKMASLMGCSIDSEKLEEEDIGNGLFSGHAYSITNLAKLNYDNKIVKLVRLRNPWGHGEWRGPWGDESKEWKSVPKHIKAVLGYKKAKDGEFWMSYEDWLTHFEELCICHLTPDAMLKELTQKESIKSWNPLKFHGQWIKGVSAGGCGNKSLGRELFWMNPQYRVTVSDSDDKNGDGSITVIVSLTQKYTLPEKNEHISFKIFKVKAAYYSTDPEKKYKPIELWLFRTPKDFMNVREVTGHFLFEPGKYVIIPSTFDPHREGHFMLRVFTETTAIPL